MKRSTAIALTAVEISLITKLFLANDPTLAFIILVSQLLLLPFILRVDPQYKIKSRSTEKSRRIIFVFLVLLLTPLLLFHHSEFEISDWKEVGLYLRHPYSSFFVFFGLIITSVSVIGSVYLRSKNGVD
jgi:hypothetical protein